ncbi:MAG: ROK family protein [Actinobacteria bacterium]|nr:ROK family protein [Actinomycetota bacterium]
MAPQESIRECLLGIDAGGTKIATAAVDTRGEILQANELETPAHDGDKMVKTFRELVASETARCRDKGLDIKAIGIAAAGYISRRDGVLIESPNIAWRMVPLKMIAEEASGLPAFLDNDANGAAAGERFAGIAKGVDDFVYITLGTGVGGGVYTDGSLLRGNRGVAAELGHIIIDPNGPVCGCGRRGCLEALASGTAMGREGAELAKQNPNTIMLEMAEGDPGKITGILVARAAGQGDETAIRAIQTWSVYLAEGIVDFIHIFDPKIVVLGGGVSESGHLFISQVQDAVIERGIRALVEGIPIVLSKLRNEAGVIGAAALAWEGISSSR